MRTIHWLLLSTLAVSLSLTDLCVGAETRAGDWFTRIRGLYVLPDDHSSAVHPIPDSRVSVHPCFTGEFDFGYMFTKNIGFELILSTTKNSIYGRKSLRHTKIGSSWLLPPTLTLQYRPFPKSSIVQPYLGAGVNYTLFYNEHCDLKSTHLSLEHSWGPALQLGTDLFFHENWFINMDVKYVWAKSEAHLRGATNAHVDVTINPWLFGIGIGRKW